MFALQKVMLELGVFRSGLWSLRFAMFIVDPVLTLRIITTALLDLTGGNAIGLYF